MNSNHIMRVKDLKSTTNLRDSNFATYKVTIDVSDVNDPW